MRRSGFDYRNAARRARELPDGEGSVSSAAKADGIARIPRTFRLNDTKTNVTMLSSQPCEPICLDLFSVAPPISFSSIQTTVFFPPGSGRGRSYSRKPLAYQPNLPAWSAFGSWNHSIGSPYSPMLLSLDRVALFHFSNLRRFSECPTLAPCSSLSTIATV